MASWEPTETKTATSRRAKTRKKTHWTNSSTQATALSSAPTACPYAQPPRAAKLAAAAAPTTTVGPITPSAAAGPTYITTNRPQWTFHRARSHLGAKLPRCIARHLGRCRWPSLPDGCVFSIPSAHLISSSSQAIEMGRTCGIRTHRCQAWNRQSQPDLLRDNKGE